MSSTIAQHKEIDSRFCGNSKKEDKNDKREVRSNSLGEINSSIIGREEVKKQFQKVNFFSLPSRKVNILFFVLIVFLISSFMVSANSSDIWFTNIWYKKLPNYTHITIKASGVISEYEVNYLEKPDRIVIDIKNAYYGIEELTKNILFLNMGSVKQVRCAQFEREPIPITRFVVDLFRKADYEVKLSPNNRLIYIDVYDYTEFKAPEEQVFTVTPVKSEAIKIEKEEPKVSIIDIADSTMEPFEISFKKDADVRDVINLLFAQAGINVITDESVTGSITLNFPKKVTFKEALNAILLTKNLDYMEIENNTVFIATKEKIEANKKPITKIFELKNATAEEAKGLLDNYIKEGEKSNISIVADKRLNNLIITAPEEDMAKIADLINEIDCQLLTKTFKINNAIYKDEIEAIKNMLSIIIPEEGRINVDSRQNEIIVRGSEEELKNVEIMIEGLDKRAPQIMIEAKIVEITLDSEKDLGIKWTSGTGDTKVEGQINVGEITLGGSFERSGLIEATLKALQTEGKTNILSNPKVLTLDGKEAKILSGSKIPIKEVTSEGVETIKYMDVGLSMAVTPHLSSDDLITMDVNTKVESLGEELIQGYPVINSREEQAIIRANLGETKVIGGLITSEDIKNIHKIPLLAEIPIFGELFKFTHTKNKKTEIIILITAHKLDY